MLNFILFCVGFFFFSWKVLRRDTLARRVTRLYTDRCGFNAHVVLRCEHVVAVTSFNSELLIFNVLFSFFLFHHIFAAAAIAEIHKPSAAL